MAARRSAASLRKDAVGGRRHRGMFPCFFGGFVSRLSASSSRARDQPGPRLGRQDDVVDVAARRGDVRIREALLVVGDERRPLRRRVGGRGDLGRGR